MLEVLYHHAKFGGAGISPAAGVAKTLSFCLIVCSSRLSPRNSLGGDRVVAVGDIFVYKTISTDVIIFDVFRT